MDPSNSLPLRDELTDCKNSINYYLDEIENFEEPLTSIIRQQQHQKGLGQTESFLTKMTLKKLQFVLLRNEINAQEKQIQSYTKPLPTEILVTENELRTKIHISNF